MYISNRVLDLLIELIKVEYGGCHAPHNDTPLYGRSAYWRIYLPDGTFVAKITTPVQSLNPTKKTLQRLFKAELKQRINDIQIVMDTTYSGQMFISERDPSSVKPLMKFLENKYYDLELSKLEKQASK
jgi:hypothetical protein